MKLKDFIKECKSVAAAYPLAVDNQGKEMKRRKLTPDEKRTESEYKTIITSALNNILTATVHNWDDEAEAAQRHIDRAIVKLLEAVPGFNTNDNLCKQAIFEAKRNVEDME